MESVATAVLFFTCTETPSPSRALASPQRSAGSRHLAAADPADALAALLHSLTLYSVNKTRFDTI